MSTIPSPPQPTTPTSAPSIDEDDTIRYWRDDEPDLYGEEAFAAATTDWGGGGAGGRGMEWDDEDRRHAHIFLLEAQHQLRCVIKRAKLVKVDMHTLFDEDPEDDECITNINSLILDAQDDLKQGIDAIYKISDKLEYACDHWEGSGSDDDTDVDDDTSYS